MTAGDCVPERASICSLVVSLYNQSTKFSGMNWHRFLVALEASHRDWQDPREINH